jgi:hypothetical protein
MQKKSEKTHIFAKIFLPVMPSLLPHVLWGRSQVFLFFASVVSPGRVTLIWDSNCKMSEYPCIDCGSNVLPRQEALQCDQCSQSLCTNWPGKKCLDSCISNSGTEPDYKKVRILFIYLFFAWTWGEINALLTISFCQMKHFGYVILY